MNPDYELIEAREQRPGVPREAAPHPAEGAHWKEPELQVPHARMTWRADLPTLTPVFGTAQPPKGLSGLMRRTAYRFPDHQVRHWLLLILADRVDVAEPSSPTRCAGVRRGCWRSWEARCSR